MPTCFVVENTLQISSRQQSCLVLYLWSSQCPEIRREMMFLSCIEFLSIIVTGCCLESVRSIPDDQVQIPIMYPSETPQGHFTSQSLNCKIKITISPWDTVVGKVQRTPRRAPNNISVHVPYPWQIVKLPNISVDGHANCYLVVQILKSFIICISVIHIQWFS